MATETNCPIPIKRLEQIAADACNNVLETAEFYEHTKTAQWNETIIQRILKALISESTPEEGKQPAYKFAINSTIVQHLVPNSQLNKSTTSTDADAATKKQAGRRGMHSATGGFWNEKTDGMWSFKWDGEAKGLDAVVMIIWIAI
ncbi:dynein light chain Tctex-type [Podospora australis]|uniref:Dynein light chain Tctex-type n=1 Tax=Podospora australis TaxID=1536484 RepID=A0AAN6X1E9_9PEZI|nr:dynein light chain Tctex-type [Podospora australis]